MKTYELTLDLSTEEIRMLNGMMLFSATVYNQYPEIAKTAKLNCFLKIVEKFSEEYHRLRLCTDKKCAHRKKGGE